VTLRKCIIEKNKLNYPACTHTKHQLHHHEEKLCELSLGSSALQNRLFYKFTSPRKKEQTSMGGGGGGGHQWWIWFSLMYRPTKLYIYILASESRSFKAWTNDVLYSASINNSVALCEAVQHQLFAVKCINSSNTQRFRWKCVMTNCYYWRLVSVGLALFLGLAGGGTYCNRWHCLARGQFKMKFYLHTSFIVITSLFTETVPLITTVCFAGYKINTIMHCSVSGRKHRHHTQKSVKFY
jgi:hypothetical protein